MTASNRAPGDRPESQGPARQRQALFAALLALLVAATLLLNIVALQLGQRLNLSYDLTANAAFKAGPETRALLAGLERDVDIYVLATVDGFQGSAYLQQAQRMLAQYPNLSPRVRLTYVDYVFDPTFASRFPQLTLAEGNVLVVCGDRVKQLALAELFNYTYTPTGALTILSSRAEEALTGAILYVTSDDPVRVAVLTGHGVADMTTFTRLLTANNYEVAQVNLATDALDGYDLALLLAPAIDLSTDALARLDAFLYNNGAYGKTLLYTADVTQPPLPNMDAFLQEWGLVVGDGAVFETQAERTYQYQPYYPVAAYVDAGYRDQLKDPSAPVLLPLSRPLELLFTTQGSLQNEVLLEFADTAGVRPSAATAGFNVQQATRWGPLPALVLASKRIYGATGVTQFRSNLVLSASNAMLDTFSIQNTSLANSEYLLNLLNTLCERTDVVNIEPKSLAGQTLAITTRQASTLGVLLAGALPLAILGAGLAVWLARRHQ
jgi:hypothetical protein